MNKAAKLVSPLSLLLLSHCTDASPDSGTGASSAARIDTQVAAAVSLAGAGAQKFRAGAATAGGLESLKYQISGITICESLETTGSAFHNQQGCLELYRHDEPSLHYGLKDDWTPLAEIARGLEDGYVDLLSTSSRNALASSTTLTREHVRSYNYGIITWALPIKVKASLRMNDGSFLYTHDGHTTFETVGVDNFRSYFTASTTSLTQAPAEEAVVLLPNGGNWFKFQSPFTITDEDIEAERAFVLDLVFNPEGIINGFSDSFAQGSISERGPSGNHLHDITVPMLDLSPVPHRASEQVVRESYQGTVNLPGNSFDLRIELYSVEGDANETVYGADVKSLVNAETRAVPPSVSKVSFLERAEDGTLTFSAHNHTATLTGLRRVTELGESTQVSLVCAVHSDRAGAEGGAAIVLDSCPARTLDVKLSLRARTLVTGGVAAGVGEGPDAGVELDAAAR